jgi:hypothetical protein
MFEHLTVAMIHNFVLLASAPRPAAEPRLGPHQADPSQRLRTILTSMPDPAKIELLALVWAGRDGRPVRNRFQQFEAMARKFVARTPPVGFSSAWALVEYHLSLPMSDDRKDSRATTPLSLGIWPSSG